MYQSTSLVFRGRIPAGKDGEIPQSSHLCDGGAYSETKRCRKGKILEVDRYPEYGNKTVDKLGAIL